MHLRDELRLMLAPRQTYQQLLAGGPPRGARAVLTRPALVALIIGTFVTLTNTGELLPTLLLGSVIAWAWVPGLQMALATPLIAACRPRVRLSSALDLFFAGHGPWSLWLLVMTALLMARLPVGLDGARELRLVVTSALVPIAWTVIITFAFCRTVLGLSVARALAWTLGYEAALWACAYFYVGAVTFRVWPFSLYRNFWP
jgi:hypothetical protein